MGAERSDSATELRATLEYDFSEEKKFFYREKHFRSKTAGNIIKLFEMFRYQKIFGRSDIMKVLDIKPSRASEMLKEMAGCGVIEAVSGYGKGKYRFRRR